MSVRAPATWRFHDRRYSHATVAHRVRLLLRFAEYAAKRGTTRWRDLPLHIEPFRRGIGMDPHFADTVCRIERSQSFAKVRLESIVAMRRISAAPGNLAVIVSIAARNTHDELDLRRSANRLRTDAFVGVA